MINDEVWIWKGNEMCLRKQFRPQNILNFMIIITHHTFYKIHEKSERTIEKRERDLTHSFNDVGWMMSFGTSPPPQENRLRNAFEETFQRLIYYCTFTICPLRQHPYDSNTCMDKRVELHIVFYVPSRAHSKLYIIIAFDMFFICRL